MTTPEVSRAEAWRLLTEYTQSESLRKHALAVEATMRWYARSGDEDQELWGCTGLLHDFDYERWPTAPDHPTQGMRILQERGWPPEIVTAIAGHAPYLGIPRETPLARTLFAVDELSGFIVAVAHVRPNRSLAEVGVDSVLRKLKDKSFARSVSREDIRVGASELSLDLDVHVRNCISALREVAGALGLP